VQVTANVADMAAMREVLTPTEPSRSLGGVFHLAVEMSEAPLDGLDEAHYRNMFTAKVQGAWVLHELTASLELDCFVVFSSTTSLWGAQRLAHYAAANQVLDSLVHWRRARGLPALAVNWGTWEMMRLASSAQRASFESAGLLPMTADGALSALGQLLAGGHVQNVVASVDWNVLKATYEARRARPFFAEISPAPREMRSGNGSQTKETWDHAQVAPLAREEWLSQRISAEVAAVLGLDDAGQVDLARGLFEMGMDSLMAVELRARLERGAGLSLPSTLTFNYPNVNALAAFIGGELFGGRAPERATIEVPFQSAAADRDELTEEDMERLLAEKLKSL
jgi:myxalamid-type polyketide synthase MxaE and MxaD